MGAALSRFLRHRRSERLSRFSSIRIGGPVPSVISVSSLSDIERVFELSENGDLPEPLSFVGRGTNILFPDDGFEGTLVRFEYRESSTACDWDAEGGVRAGAAFPLPTLAREAAKRGVGGFEFLSGIPGTVGGATVMNAGAGGHSWAELCVGVTLLVPSGEVVTVPKEKMQFGYRSSCLSAVPGEGNGKFCRSIVLEATLSGKPSSPESCQASMNAHLSYRKRTQPLDEPSLGSVFKNPDNSPEGHTAGRLIDLSGLKDSSRGGVAVSSRHANFFVNTGEGRAKDFLELLSFVTDRVKERWGVILEPEVKLWTA